MAPATRGVKLDLTKVFDTKLPPELKKRRITGKPKRQLSDAEYTVRAILGKRQTKHGAEFLISWTDFPSQATWEPASVIQQTCPLLIADFLEKKPVLQPPSADMVSFSLSHLGTNLLGSLQKEGDQLLRIPFPEAVFRHLFHDLEIADGWYQLTEEKLQAVFNQSFEHRYKNTPDEGRRLHYPIKIKPAIKRSNGSFAEFLLVELRKDSATF